MKKLSIFFSALVAALGFTGCSEDTEPVYQEPTKFVLNTPVLQNQLMELSPEGTFELVCSQPDYGYSAITKYSAEVAIDENFSKFVTLTPVGTGTLARMTFNQKDLALGLCELHNIDSEEAYQDVYGGVASEKVYFRAVAELANVSSSRITSNVVAYNQVLPYYAVPTPGYIWLIGDCGGWVEPSESNTAALANWRLFEADDAIGSKIYSGVFDVPQGKATFRFYTALTGWDGGDSYGSQEEDSPIAFEFTDGKFENALVHGKGSFQFPDWTGGEMTIVIDMSGSNATITILAGAQSVVTAKYVYMVGSQAGWAEPNEEAANVYSNWRLADTDGSGVYSGTFNLDAQDWYFRVYPALEGWGSTPYSAAADGSNVDITLGTSYPCVAGEGCWHYNWTGGKVNVTLDTNTNKITVNAVE